MNPNDCLLEAKEREKNLQFVESNSADEEDDDSKEPVSVLDEEAEAASDNSNKIFEEADKRAKELEKLLV